MTQIDFDDLASSLLDALAEKLGILPKDIGPIIPEELSIEERRAIEEALDRGPGDLPLRLHHAIRNVLLVSQSREDL